MTTYIEVAQALVSAGYLSEADIEAAADVLDDVLIIADDEEWQEAAADDYADQEDLVAEAEIAAAYLDAASALLAAELIDEANLRAAAAVIADTWVVDVE